MKISKSIYMGYSNGQLETSSGIGQGEKGEPGLPEIGFNLTDDGNFDLDSKRLTDVADPVHDQDAATKNILMIMSLGMLLAKLMLTQKTLDKILLLIQKQKEMKYFFLMEVKS